MIANKKTQQRKRRHSRIRARVAGTPERPRLCVFKSNAYVYAQLIDDVNNRVISGVTSQKIAKDKGGMEQAQAVGTEIAKRASDAKIDTVVFDRGGFIYTGKVKAVAEAARSAGLKF